MDKYREASNRHNESTKQMPLKSKEPLVQMLAEFQQLADKYKVTPHFAVKSIRRVLQHESNKQLKLLEKHAAC